MSRIPSDDRRPAARGRSTGRPAGAAGEPIRARRPADALSDIAGRGARARRRRDADRRGRRAAGGAGEPALPGVPSRSRSRPRVGHPSATPGPLNPGLRALAERPEPAPRSANPSGTPEPRRPAATRRDGAAPRRRLKSWAPVSGAPRRGWSSGLLALLGFALVVQLRSNTATDGPGHRPARGPGAHPLRPGRPARSGCSQEIAQLRGEPAAAARRRARAGRRRWRRPTQRADELGILAGTLPAQRAGPGDRVRRAATPIQASACSNAVRGAARRRRRGDADRRRGRRTGAHRRLHLLRGRAERRRSSCDGRRSTGPYTITVIGDPQTMQTALNIPGGVVASVEQRRRYRDVERTRRRSTVTALHQPTALQHAKPVPDRRRRRDRAGDADRRRTTA